MMLATVQRQESPTAGRHNVEMTAQVVSLRCRDVMRCAPVMRGTIRLTETQ